jgi:hypothetical protein
VHAEATKAPRETLSPVLGGLAIFNKELLGKFSRRNFNSADIVYCKINLKLYIIRKTSSKENLLRKANR